MKGALGENGELDALTGKKEGEPQAEENGAPKEPNGKPKENGVPKKENSPPKKNTKENKTVDGVLNKTPAGEVGKASGVDLKDPKKAADVGKLAGKTGDLKKATDVAGGVL